MKMDSRKEQPGSEQEPIQRLRDGTVGSPPEPDWLAAEAPLEIRLHGRPAAVLMRTPGGEQEDRELVLGFLFCEGVISDAKQVLGIEPLEELPPDAMGGTVVDVRLDSPSRGRSMERFFYNTSSCGACGKRSIDSLAVRRLRSYGGSSETKVSAALVADILSDARKHQRLFALTGGVHASGLYTRTGERVVLREDVGRHNALDKVIGAGLLLGRMPMADDVLAISGRVGYEIIQKAAAAGISFVAAVGAPTSLAVRLADEHGITVVGFAKGQSMNVYCHRDRVV